MDLNLVLKARQDVDEALGRYMELIYGPGINQRWVVFSDRLDAATDRRVIAFGLSDMTSWDLNGLSRQAFPLIERFVESLM